MPGLELSAFDIEKLLKERFRHEPLTLGAAWHHGYFRSYFSHAAITHPANDGLREEFSTAWDIVRKRPAVVFRGAAVEASGERGRRLSGPTATHLAELAAVRLDLPMIVGPLPFAAGVGLELAYLRAIAGADEGHDVRTRTLVVIEADRALRHAAELLPHAAALMVRLTPRHAALLAGASPDRDGLMALLRGARVVELDPWNEQSRAEQGGIDGSGADQGVAESSADWGSADRGSAGGSPRAERRRRGRRRPARGSCRRRSGLQPGSAAFGPSALRRTRRRVVLGASPRGRRL